MFKKQQGCTKEVIDTNAGYTVDVWVPPLGYGFNYITGEIEKTDIIKRRPQASAQYWERLDLPADWKKKRAVEKRIQGGDKKSGIEPNPDHFDPYLEDVRDKHWLYRMNGVWVYMNGKPVYITGEHWFYMNWWSLDKTGYPEYRDSDRRRFYFQEYCVWDDKCAGIMEASNRRSGKSFRAGVFMYNYISITADSVGGIQSKTGPDGSKFFRSKIITPFKKLPDFFQPETNTAGGDSFTSKIEFAKITKRGKAALDNMDDLGLNSVIDWRSSKEYDYDGQPLHRCTQDEVGKESDGNPYDRWGVVKECLIVGKKIIGKAIVTTTPEEIKGLEIESTPFYKLWHESKFFDKNGKSQIDGNGRTPSWLYAYYIPAWENIEVDKFGMPKKEANIEFIMNARASNKKKGQKKYLDEMKKHTITEEEMFMATLDGNCLFNEQNITERIDALTGIHDHYVQGNFMWENGMEDTKVVFKPSKTGRWFVLKTFSTDDFGSNKVEYRGDIKRPMNVNYFTIGVDPFDHDNVESGKGSQGAIVVLQKYNPYRWLESNKAAVCIYLNRPKTSALLYEDVILTAVWFGADFLYETQKIGIKRYCQNRGYEPFFVKFDGRQDFGVASSPELKQHGAGLIEFMVEDYSESFFFIVLLTQLALFDIKHTEKFDLAMAYMYALISDASRLVKHKQNSTVKALEDILPYYLLDDLH